MQKIPVARGALAKLGDDAGPSRIAVELDAEQVTFVHRHGGLFALCTCGRDTCAHVARALALLEPEPELGVRTGSRVSLPRVSIGPAARESQGALAPVLVGPSSRPAPPAAAPRAQALALAIDELALSTARAGVAHPESPSVKAALDALVVAAGEPVPLGLSRFIGRFQEALAVGEVGRVARLLDGLAGFGAVLGGGLGGPAAEQLTRAWLSLGEGAPDALSDVVLVEVAREWLHGLTRHCIERRYLVEPSGTGIYCEERRRGSPGISVGPCPRVVHVAYGELDPATRPAHLRLLQYTVSPEPSAAQWSDLADRGVRSFQELLGRYTRELHEAPALAEPFVLVAPERIEEDYGGVLCDGRGARLELSDDAGGSVLAMLRRLAGDDDLVWISGRLRGTSRGIALRPTSVLVRTAAGHALRRIT
jgi:hypothetical protein